MAKLYILKQAKGSKSCITDAALGKLSEHGSVMRIHDCFKFQEIPFTGWLDMPQVVDFKAIQGQQLMQY